MQSFAIGVLFRLFCPYYLTNAAQQCCTALSFVLLLRVLGEQSLSREVYFAVGLSVDNPYEYLVSQ